MASARIKTGLSPSERKLSLYSSNVMQLPRYSHDSVNTPTPKILEVRKVSQQSLDGVSAGDRKPTS